MCWLQHSALQVCDCHATTFLHAGETSTDHCNNHNQGAMQRLTRGYQAQYCWDSTCVHATHTLPVGNWKHLWAPHQGSIPYTLQAMTATLHNLKLQCWPHIWPHKLPSCAHSGPTNRAPSLTTLSQTWDGLGGHTKLCTHVASSISCRQQQQQQQ